MDITNAEKVKQIPKKRAGSYFSEVERYGRCA
jgi:hypothetical protein